MAKGEDIIRDDLLLASQYIGKLTSPPQAMSLNQKGLKNDSKAYI